MHHFNCPLRFQIQQYVTQLVQPQQYGSTAFGRFDNTARYGVETSPLKYLRGRGRGRFRGRFYQSPAIHTMVEAPMVPIEYADYQYEESESKERNESAGKREDQNSTYID